MRSFMADLLGVCHPTNDEIPVVGYVCHRVLLVESVSSPLLQSQYLTDHPRGVFCPVFSLHNQNIPVSKIHGNK